MNKRIGLIYGGVVFCLLLCSFILPFNSIQQQNQAPVVKIIAPKTNGNFDWGAQVNYQVSVADKEDGDSKYEEINGMEVLLEVKYAGSKTILPVATKATPEAPGLAVIRTSNCFNCHSFNGKLIGPSFHDIGIKYPVTAANIDLLTKRIKEGSAGIWGKVSMPTHPELTTEEAASTVKWILKQANDPNISYYTGTEGSFRTRPAGTEKKGTYILTASYTDHGPKSAPGKQRLQGQDVVILQSK
jgi:cytochrome c